MTAELTPLNAWDKDVAQMIDDYRVLFLERFQDFEPIAEDCQADIGVQSSHGLTFSELSAVLFRREADCEVVDQRQARIVVPSSFGYRTSLNQGVIARFASVEIKTLEPRIETTVEKRYLITSNEEQGTRPLSIVSRGLRSEHIEADNGSKKYMFVDSSRSKLTVIEQLDMFFGECVELVVPDS